MKNYSCHPRALVTGGAGFLACIFASACWPKAMMFLRGHFFLVQLEEGLKKTIAHLDALLVGGR
jgi:hypothetical protein